jgi:hypothetical protein
MIKHRLIGTYQIITGVFGALMIILNIGKVFENREILFTVFIGCMLFCGLAFSGYALYNGLKSAVKYSILAQAIQSVSIITNGTQYLFTGSAYFSFNYRCHSFSFDYQISPIAYNISEISKSVPFELTVFFVPLLLILILVYKK